MPSHRALNSVGSWALVALGVGHLVTSQLTPASPARDAVISAMEAFAIVMPGRAGNLYQYYSGFSLMMGVLLIAYGALALVALRGKAVDSRADRPVLATNALVSAVAVAMSIQFFFAVPIVLTAVALAAYSGALALSWLRAGDPTEVSVLPAPLGAPMPREVAPSHTKEKHT
jgi:hypothetical protein